MVETQPIKQEHEAAKSGRVLKKDVIVGALRTESGDIFDTDGGYDVTENEEEEIHEGDIFNFCVRVR